MPVFFIDSSWVHENRVVITGPLVQHLRASLRVKTGEELWVGDGTERRYRIRLDSIDAHQLIGTIEQVRLREDDSSIRVIVGHALIKAHRMAWMIQKTTELGMIALVPLITARSVVHPAHERQARQTERFQRIALEAAQQAERWAVPTIHPPQSLQTFLDQPPPCDLKVLLWEGEAERRLSHALRDSSHARSVSVLVGPEGGFTDVEVDLAREKGYRTVTLGNLTLRSETAAFAALSILQSELG